MLYACERFMNFRVSQQLMNRGAIWDCKPCDSGQFLESSETLCTGGEQSTKSARALVWGQYVNSMALSVTSQMVYEEPSLKCSACNSCLFIQRLSLSLVCFFSPFPPLLNRDMSFAAKCILPCVSLQLFAWGCQSRFENTRGMLALQQVPPFSALQCTSPLHRASDVRFRTGGTVHEGEPIHLCSQQQLISARDQSEARQCEL